MSRFSFRARVFGLVVVVAIATAAATAWLIVRQTSEKLIRDTAIAQQDVDRIISEITAFGMLTGSWQDVGPLVNDLAVRTGQRVRLQTTDGVTFADSAPSASTAAARQTGTIETRRAPAFSDVLPHLRSSIAAQELLRYRQGAERARCWQRHGIDVGVLRDGEGRYEFMRLRQEPQAAECGVGQATVSSQVDESSQVFSARCGPALETGCLQQVFAEQIHPVTPPPALVLIGAFDQPPAVEVELTPALSAAALVALLVVAVSLLISSRVVRPIGALAAAARRLGQGHLSERVPERGGDELARLTRSFNDMAKSLQQSKEQQHNMIADIAHELRTPLTNIRGYLEALKDGVFRPDSELFKSLYDEAMLQQRLLDDLQELALAESGTLVYHPTAVDLAELLQACRTAHASAAAAVDVRLEIDAPAPVPTVGDQDRLRQVIGNLVTNALRATPDGGVITLRAHAENGCAVIGVTDTGSGIKAEDLPHVFDRFWRADTSRGRATGGGGLGLSIAREIVAAHHGTITVTSTEGTGTVFTVRLPLRKER